MEIKHSFVIRILMLIVAGIGECLAVKHLTVIEGDTLVLKCLRKNSVEKVHMEWRNPHGHVMFFNNHRGLRDSRVSVFILNDSEYTIHLSSVTLKDEGVYKCLQYEDKVISKRYKVKVLGTPKIEKAEYGDKTVLKCSSPAYGHPPELSWLLSGIEVEAQPHTIREGGSNRLLVVSVLKVKPHIRKATVMCLAKHQALQKPLMDFVIIENDSITAPTSSYSRTTDKLKTETMLAVTSVPFSSSTANIEWTSPPDMPKLSSTEESNTLNSTPTQYTAPSDTNSTEGFQIENGTSSEGFGKEDRRKPEQQNVVNQSSPLLVLLVTCLIICLLIVVIFFAIKLRKAHQAWKKENEESEQSVESSKSKSSHEEKHAQERRRIGFWNSKFTEYKIEDEVPQNIANSNSPAEVTSEAQDSSRTASSSVQTHVRETEI